MKKNLIWVVTYVTPIIFLLSGMAFDIMVIPYIYDENISFILGFFIKPENTLHTLLNPYMMKSEICRSTKILIQSLEWVWSIGFYTSLFFVCKRLHFKVKQPSNESVLVKRNAHLAIQDVRERLKQLKGNTYNRDLNKLIFEVKCIEEKMSILSDFRYSNDDIIACENEIAKQLQILTELVLDIEGKGFHKKKPDLNRTIREINVLLRRRNELEKLSSQ